MDFTAPSSKAIFESIRKEAYAEVETKYKLEDAEDFVMSMPAEAWRFTEPYTSEQIEKLVDSLYRFVELNVALTQIMKAFDGESRRTTIAFSSVENMVNQDTTKTYNLSRDRTRLSTISQREEEEQNKKYHKKKAHKLQLNENRISWFYDKKAYVDLGEEVMKMVGLLRDYEKCDENNYTPADIDRRISSLEIEDWDDDGKYGPDHEDLFDAKHERRMLILQNKLLECFSLKLYPEFEDELRFFLNKTRDWLIPELSAKYVDSMVIHHYHYFPDMEPIGMAHWTCNVKTYTKGVPTPHIYVHNLANYDSNFILKMIPNYVMAHKGKNTQNQWSVIERMTSALGLDLTNFASTAKYSYVLCKRMMNMIMQTVPNGRVYSTIREMMRAGFSMIKKQVSLASPFNKHVEECQYSPECEKCWPFMQNVEKSDLPALKEETHRVIKECKSTLENTLTKLREVHEVGEVEDDQKLLDAVQQVQDMYELLKTQAFVKPNVTSEEMIETICVLQSCIIYFDENNQYGSALKQILPIGNYVWLNYSKKTGGDVQVETLVKILADQTIKLRADKKARVVDFYTCVDLILPNTCSKADLQREEEFNLLVRNQVPEVYNFTEKMLRSKRNEYKLRSNRYTSLSLYKKVMSGTAPQMKYWIHSSILKTALNNGWKVTRVHNTLTFTAPRCL